MNDLWAKARCLLLTGIVCFIFAACSDNNDEKNETMTKEQLMREAIRLSEENVSNGGGPFGAVIARDGKIVATGVNRVTANNDPTAHAEVVAIRAAAEKLGRWNLSDCELFVTLEPCVMCAGAIVYSRIARVVYGAKDLRFGACGTVLNIAENTALNHRATVVGGILEDECIAPIKAYFKARRKNT